MGRGQISIYPMDGRPAAAPADVRLSGVAKVVGLLQVAGVWRRGRTLPSGSGQLRLGTDQESIVRIYVPYVPVFCLLYGLSLVHRDVQGRQPRQPTKGAIKSAMHACIYTERTLLWLAHGTSPVTESR